MCQHGVIDMSWITELFSSSLGAVVEKAGGAIDKLVTSDEERELLKNALAKIGNEAKSESHRHIEAQEQAVTERHKTDMGSDSWLSKNIRPMALIFLTVSVVVLAYVTLFVDSVDGNVLDSWIGLFSGLLMLVYGFYFGSRGLEKISSMITEKNKR
jgi:hypothetical protein